MTKRRSSLPAVTGVRIVLALWVVVFHLATTNLVLRRWLEGAPVAIQHIIGSGPAAVSVFFLLSGFVLAYNYDLLQVWTPERRRGFWIARLARVYPMYCFALVVGLPSLFAGLIKAGPLHPGEILRRMGEVLLLVQAWVPRDALFWGGPAWSLSVEAVFYVTFPFLGRFLWRVERRDLQMLTLAGLWLASCVGVFALGWWKAPFFLLPTPHAETVWSEVIKWNPLVRLPEFLSGIVLCKLYLGLQREPVRWLRPGRGWVLYVPGMLLMAVVTGENQAFAPALLHDGLLLPASSAVVLGLSFGGGLVARYLSRPGVVLMGQVSYGIYLLHMPIYTYFAAAAKRLPLSKAGWWALLGCYIVCLFAVSTGAYFWVEERGRRAILGRLSPGRRGERSVWETAPVSADPM